MVQLSTGRKLGILARIAMNSAGRNRTLGAAMNGAKITGKHVGRVANVLWLEVTGFVFFAIGVISGLATFREYHRYQAGEIGVNRVVLAAVIAVMFAWFGASSFWRVKKKKG
jgi:hypothetical protein